MKFAGVAGTLALALLPVSASADPISVIYSSRSLFASAQLQYPSGPQDVQAEHDADDLNAAAHQVTPTGHAQASASLQSSISDPTHLFGSGLVTASLAAPTLGHATGATAYYVGLGLEQPYQYTFDGRFDGTGLSSGVRWAVQLSGSGGPILMDQQDTDAGRVTQTGTLPPGNWYLLVIGSANDSAASRLQYGFTMDLAPVTPPPSPTPEPASMLLLGTGVAGAIRARRRP